jgi:signal transduction histidine kinase/DNA-binding response OmpR family regulator
LWLGRARWLVPTLIGVGIVLNVVIGQIVRNVLYLPIYLDSIGTILAGALGGPLVGAATGALSNLVWGLLFNDPGIIPYALTAACIGACAAAAARLGAFASLPATLLAGLITGAIAALVSAPITAYITQGASGAGTIVLREVLASTSDNLLQAVTLQGFVSDPLDKALSFLVVFGLLHLLPAPVQLRFAEARQISRSHRLSARYGAAVLLSLVAFLCALVFRPAFGTDVYAIFYLAVVLSAWYGGLGPGVLAGCVGIFAMLLFEAPPLGPGLGVDDWLRVIIFISVAFLVALITDRLDRSNSALEDALAETRAVVNGVVEALLLVSPGDRRVLSVNRQFETLFSVGTSEVRGRGLDELHAFVDKAFAEPDTLRERFTEVADDDSATFTQTFKQVWPQERLLELFSAPVLSDRKFVGRLYGFRDVTQERELDRMKTEFVSQVSHELRTPLTAIKGFTELVLDGDAGDINEEQTEYLGIVKSNVDRLMALINDLLDIARIESGRVQLKIAPVDLDELVKLVGQSMRPLVQGKDQTLRTEIEPNLPVVMADRDRVVQVLTNLVSNAHKYTPAGGSILVRAHTVDGMVKIEVQDNGMGIPAEDVPRLFSRFFRVDSSLTREIGGTGLGLSIVKSIVELHGGAVTVDSVQGEGSTFDFTLPLAPVSIAQQRTVLLVDGEDSIGDELSRAGYLVETAVSPAHALEQSAQRRPDLIVLRLRLASRGCLEQAQGLAEAAESQGIPLLVISHPDVAPGATRPVLDDAQLVDHVQRALTESAQRRVLVIEDDPSIRKLLSTRLTERGFEAIEAADGESGLQLAEQREPDLVLLDLHLPGIDGFTVLHRLKHTPSTAGTPVIAVTGDEDLLLGARARVLALGASDFVEKPFQMDALIDEIRALTGEREREYADSHTGR